MMTKIKHDTTETVDGNLIHNGRLVINGGTLDVTGTITGTGTIAIEHGGRLMVGDSISPRETVDLSNGVLEFTQTARGPTFTASGVVTTDLNTITHITAASTIQVDGRCFGASRLAQTLLCDIIPTGGYLNWFRRTVNLFLWRA
jgi:hypothetical protein